MYSVPCRMVNDAQLRNRSFSACVAAIKLPPTPKCGSWVEMSYRRRQNVGVTPLRTVRNSDSGANCERHTEDGLTLL